jgi:hypothetical protein
MPDILNPLGVPVSSSYPIGDEISWFRRFLSQNSVKLNASSPLGKSLSRLDLLAQHLRGEFQLPKITNPAILGQELLGVSFLIKAIHMTVQCGVPEWLKGRLRLLRSARTPFRQPATRSQEQDEIWELTCACIASSFCEDVMMGNPDVTATFDRTKWGIECKVFYSKDRDTQAKAIIKGSNQVEESDVDLGIVVINVTPLIQHERYSVVEGRQVSPSFPDPRVPDTMLRNEMENIVNELPWKKIEFHFARSSSTGRTLHKTRSVLFTGQCTAIVTQIPTVISWPLHRKICQVHGPEEDFVDRFTREAAAIMRRPVL